MYIYIYIMQIRYGIIQESLSRGSRVRRTPETCSMCWPNPLRRVLCVWVFQALNLGIQTMHRPVIVNSNNSILMMTMVNDFFGVFLLKHYVYEFI